MTRTKYSFFASALLIVLVTSGIGFGQEDEKISAAEKVYDEARSLVRMGTAESARAGREKYLHAAGMFREAGEKLGEGRSLIYAGNASLKLSDYSAAIDVFGRALVIFRAQGDKEWQSTALNNTGHAYSEMGDSRKALEYYALALPISREMQDIPGQAATLNNIGAAYDVLGEWKKALEFYAEAMPFYRADDDESGEATVLSNMGVVYETLGEKKKGIEHYERALKLWRSAGNEFGEATTLNNIGKLYNDVGASQKGLEVLNFALKLRRKLGDAGGEAVTLNNIGKIYSDLRNQPKALEYYSLALPLEQKIGDRYNEGMTLNNIAAAYEHMGQKQKALEYYNLSLPIRNSIGDRVGEATTLNNLMLLWAKLDNPATGVIYGKKAINIYQRLRSEIKGLDKGTQKSYIESIEYTYRGLADILIRSGRLLEAQSILGLIKEQEYSEVTTRSGPAVETFPYSDVETSVAAKIDKLIEIGREHALLRKEQKDLGDQFPAERLKRLEHLSSDIKIANAEFEKAITSLGKADQGVETRTLEIKGEKNLQSALQTLGKELNTGVVALYTLLGTESVESKPDTLTAAKTVTKTKFGWMILVTPKDRKAYPIDVTDLEQLVFQFRNALSSDKYDPVPVAKKLYKAIFQQTSVKQKTSLEADLREIFSTQTNKTLMWSLDGVLRYIPMAALHDGDGYLVEKYRHVLFTKESLLWLMNQPKVGADALGLGVSAGNIELKMSSLPGVEKELSDIIKQSSESTGILGGTRKLNAAFKKQEILDLKDEDNKFQTVHIASHYNFDPTDQNASYLLVGDGKLTFGEMKNENNLFGTVDLLTLSACDTGVGGNGKEAEGFAFLAQSLGAKSVIASLWKVSDAGTPELMIRFYKLRAADPQMSKGEAFRKAQLEMMGINTDARSTETTRARLNAGTASANLPLYNPSGKPKFAHPHFWAPFVLIGNWK